jgi:hypothetical protein
MFALKPHPPFLSHNMSSQHSIWISCFKVLFGCKNIFEHPASVNSENKLCGNIYLLSFGGNYCCTPVHFTCILIETTKIYEEKFVGLKKIQ